MRNGIFLGVWVLVLIGFDQLAVASDGSTGDSSEAFGGFAILLGVIAIAYALVFVLKLLARSESLAPDERDAIEFTKYNTPIDRPSIER